MAPENQIVPYYRARASEYEQIYYRDVPARQAELAAAAEQLHTAAAGKRVLELACGTGYWTQILAQSAESVLASDLSSEMLVEARKKQFARPVEFVLADIHNLPFARARFELIVVGFWFSHEPKEGLAKLIDSVNGCLATGGTVWWIDNNPPAESSVNRSIGIDSFGNNYKHRQLDDGRRFTIIKNYFSPDELNRWFSPHYETVVTTYGEYYWTASCQKPK